MNVTVATFFFKRNHMRRRCRRHRQTAERLWHAIDQL